LPWTRGGSGRVGGWRGREGPAHETARRRTGAAQATERRAAAAECAAPHGIASPPAPGAKAVAMAVASAEFSSSSCSEILFFLPLSVSYVLGILPAQLFSFAAHPTGPGDVAFLQSRVFAVFFFVNHCFLFCFLFLFLFLFYFFLKDLKNVRIQTNDRTKVF
jgi:hypothetical protein